MSDKQIYGRIYLNGSLLDEVNENLINTISDFVIESKVRESILRL